MDSFSASAKQELHDPDNGPARLADRYIRETSQHIFLTGRAGTGKTTFLHNLVANCEKQLAVVAPTGVAAINAKGVTIHSLFQLPFGTLTPDKLPTLLGRRKLNRDKARVLRGLDLLIIDEISMVRADVLDAIDWTLRRYRDGRLPFGGVQLLMIGDMHQLPPVVTDAEQHELGQHYRSPYFFSSTALQKAGFTTIELTKIYRQRDAEFVRLLNEVRDNRMSPELLSSLNARCIPATTDPEPGVITLTSHRNSAKDLNAQELAKLTGAVKVYMAKVEGNFSPQAYPTVLRLELKVGAQVMFVKNDPPPHRAYFNGKLGTVTGFRDDSVLVQCPGDPDELVIDMVTWEKKKYKLNEKTKEIAEDLEGTFTQIPLRLAWAITIHKSQGLTFDRVRIDAAAAFAHGQVYVALSRCRTLEGIELLSQIGSTAVRTDSTVGSFSESQEVPTHDDFIAARAKYRKRLVAQCFDFGQLERDLKALVRVAIEEEPHLVGANVPALEQLVQECEHKIFVHGRNFLPVLAQQQAAGDYTQERIPVDERTRKASAYFLTHVQEALQKRLGQLSLLSDDSKVQAKLTRVRKAFERSLRIALAQLQCCQEPFTQEQMLRARATADLADGKAGSGKKSRTPRPTIEPTPVTEHPELYKQLYGWRKARALADGRRATSVLPTQVLVTLTNELPVSEKAMRLVEGFGSTRRKNYAPQIQGLIEDYCKANNLTGDLRLAQVKKQGAPLPKLTPTRADTYQRYVAGASIEEIAEARELKPATIASHLHAYVRHGKLPLRDFVSEEQQTDIEAGIAALQLDVLDSINGLFEHFGGKYDYSILRLVLQSQGQQLLAKPGEEE